MHVQDVGAACAGTVSAGVLGSVSAEGYELRVRQLQRPVIQSYTARCGPGGVTGMLGSYDNRGMCQVGCVRCNQGGGRAGVNKGGRFTVNPWVQMLGIKM